MHRRLLQRLCEEPGNAGSVRIFRVAGRANAVCHRGIDNARFHQHDPHAERLHLNGERLAHRLKRPLRSAVRRHRRMTERAGHRADIDDRAAAALPHLRHHRLDAANRSEIIRFHASAEIVHGRFFYGARSVETGVVDEHVDRAVLRLDCRNGIADRIVAIHVHGADEDRQALGGRFLGERGRCSRIAHGRVDTMSGAGECQRCFVADPFAGASDENGCHRLPPQTPMSVDGDYMQRIKSVVAYRRDARQTYICAARRNVDRIRGIDVYDYGVFRRVAGSRSWMADIDIHAADGGGGRRAGVASQENRGVDATVVFTGGSSPTSRKSRDVGHPIIILGLENVGVFTVEMCAARQNSHKERNGLVIRYVGDLRNCFRRLTP